MKIRRIILAVLLAIALNVVLLRHSVRFDLSEDKRYTISASTKEYLQHNIDCELQAQVMLSGNLNAGFSRLQTATIDMLRELSRYANISLADADDEELAAQMQMLEKNGYNPTQIYETTGDGKQQQTIVYPYVLLSDGKHIVVANLLVNNPSQSGAENLNTSIEQLEYTLLRAIHLLVKSERPKVAFLEGHGELPELNTADLQQALAPYCDIYFGTITDDARCLDEFRCVVVADPTERFSEHDKYIIDQYIMHGGRVLWVVNGVRLSTATLTDNGFTPVLPLDLNIQDMLFRYGFRINHNLVEDVQCLPIPVDMSADPTQHNYMPMPWVYSPLLNTSAENAITRGIMQVNATFASTVSFVGSGDGQQRQVLLFTSSNSKTQATPAEVDLTDLSQNPELFTDNALPVAASIEGTFPSLFAHRMIPDSIENSTQQMSEGSSRQVIVACGAAIQNELQNGKPLPLGFDRYSKMQFGNRDFFLNTILYLTDNDNLLQLRQKNITLRLLNKQRTQEHINGIRLLIIGMPLLVLCLIGLTITIASKKKYSRYKTNIS